MYDGEFMRSIARDSSRSAPIVLDAVFKELGGVPASVVDVGCGSGGWLAECAERGAEVLGLDGEYARSSLGIPTDRFVVADLTKPISLPPGRYELAICMEVAEHLPAERGPSLVSDLVALADDVLFSAAIPGQSGRHHVNCRWQSYWAGLFESHGYAPIDCVRPVLWNEPAVNWWYRQNVLLYRRGAASRLPMPLDVMHPGCVRGELVEPEIPATLRLVGSALRRSAAYRETQLRKRLDRRPKRNS